MVVVRPRRGQVASLAVLLVAGLLAVGLSSGDSASAGSGQAQAAAVEPELPPGFRDEIIMGDNLEQVLDQPTAAEQAEDGRVFVLQKDGRLKMFDSMTDTSSVTLVNLEEKVHNYVDRGALGMTLHPDFATNGYVYVMFTLNRRLEDAEGTAPRWSGPYSPNYDDCPTEADGCAVSNRIMRFTVDGEEAVDPRILITDWCQQYFSHSAGALEFGQDDYLYASAGEGARYENNESYDVGQYGGNPCQDPVAAGNEQGGRLRAQDVRSTGDPTGLSGSVIRVDVDAPLAADDQVAPAPGNPLSGTAGADLNAKRMVAHGFRNPFRMAIRPGSRSDLYVGDVGESAFEEINQIGPTLVGGGRSQMRNAGWPCFEGPNRYPDIARLPLCGSLAPSAVTGPLFKYGHTEEVTYEEECSQETGSISALAFAEDPAFPGAGDPDFPAGVEGGLVFADYARNCIWYLPPTGDGTPNSSDPQILVEHAGTPVDLFTGNDGALYYVDVGIGANFENIGGKIHRIRYDSGRPVARMKVADGSQAYGAAPLTVTFDAGESSDPNAADVLTYEWDLDGNGSFETDTGEVDTAQRTYTNGAQNVVVTVRVSDPGELADEAQVTVYPGNTPPSVSMVEPSPLLQWGVGEPLDFSGTATDNGPLSAANYSWSFTMEHCPGDCHSHPLLSVSGETGGSFTTIDHELPSFISARLTVTDSRGLATTVRREVQPYNLPVTVGTSPNGLRYTVDGRTITRPLTQRFIANASVLISTPRRQYLAGKLWQFKSWPGARPISHTLVVPRRDDYTHRATFVPVKRRLQVLTQPRGLRVNALGGARRSGFATAVQVGERVGISAPRTQVYRGFRYRFVRWSDRGAAYHVFRMPDKNTYRTAVYRRVGRA